ncbi:PREDICTED: LOC110749049 isoform [Prunus dulcis]|uniref:PREDICTED: LOC110749049 isoform n=1 Tax=Prunus dulcis TaxID=3755 RepID=A0A5E4FV66_PRUDU|nr:uncharacterized protein LOC117635053 isoform X2 [Prunus dulcis]VVA31364.1 PREDICTED: LOC110749049 isoform [Prunus dulcis]
MSVILRNNKTPKSQNPNCCLPSILVSVLWKSKRYALIVVLGILMGQRVGNGFGFGYVGGNNLVVDLNPIPYAIGPPDPRFEVGAVYETSKEVSSMPKVQPLSSVVAKWCGEVQLLWATAMRIRVWRFGQCTERGAQLVVVFSWNMLRVFHLERPGLGLKEIAQEYNMNWDSSNTEVGSSILNLEFF